MNISKKYVACLTLFVTLANGVFLDFVSAADWWIPRNNLVSEYLYSNGAVTDTSGNNNAAQWVGITYGYDGSWAINYAMSTWTGQISGLLWWWSDEYTAFVFSTWIRFDSLPTMTTGSCPLWYTWSTSGCWGSDSQGTVYVPQLGRYLFTSQRPTSPASDLSIYINTDYGCYIENSRQSFDCSFIKDLKWHHVVARRDDYWTFYIYIDGLQKAIYRNFSMVRFWKSISVWKHPSVNSASIVGKFAATRVYRADIGVDGVNALYSEFPLLQPGFDPKNPVITIANPDTLPTNTKTFSASTSTGTLQMSITRGDSCNSTLTFEDYTPLTYSSVSDNGIKICYKATNGTLITYKMSNMLSGVTGLSSTFTPDSIFDENAYKTWPSSGKVKLNDYTYSVLGAMTWKNDTNYINFIDVNGDGLVDVLYNYSGYRAILANSWDYNFKPTYKCKTANGLYYWDCADLNYK